MFEVAAHYWYLTCSLVYAIIITGLARFTLTRAQFALTMLSGLIVLPVLVFVPFLEGNYWHPVRLGGWVIGIEDALISFDSSANAWYLVAVAFGPRLEYRYQFGRSLRRYLLAIVVPAAIYLAGIRLRWDPMTALLLTYLLAGFVFWCWHRSDWRFIVIGGFGYCLTLYAIERVSFGFFPGMIQQWNLDGPWGAVIAGLPLGEIVWALLYGAYWPLFTALVYEVTLRPRSDTVAPSAG